MKQYLKNLIKEQQQNFLFIIGLWIGIIVASIIFRTSWEYVVVCLIGFVCNIMAIFVIAFIIKVVVWFLQCIFLRKRGKNEY